MWSLKKCTCANRSTPQGRRCFDYGGGIYRQSFTSLFGKTASGHWGKTTSPELRLELTILATAFFAPVNYDTIFTPSGTLAIFSFFRWFFEGVGTHHKKARFPGLGLRVWCFDPGDVTTSAPPPIDKKKHRVKPTAPKGFSGLAHLQATPIKTTTLSNNRPHRPPMNIGVGYMWGVNHRTKKCFGQRMVRLQSWGGWSPTTQSRLPRAWVRW